MPLGPELVVTRTNVEDGVLGANDAIEISFDRFLNPASAIRQSFRLRDAFGLDVEPGLVTYDPVSRTVRISSPSVDGKDWLKPDQSYSLILGIPQTGEDLGGFRATDGATMGRSSKRLYAFFARNALAPTGTPALARVSFCNDVFPVITSKCTACHQGSTAAMGLRLSNEQEIREAVTRTSRETLQSGRSDTPAATGFDFGVDMPLIAPGSPGTSYLLYKVMMREPSTTNATASCGPVTDVPGAPTEPSREERARLSNLFAGEGMPSGGASLTASERMRLSRWIGDGAVVTPCKCEKK